VGPFAAGPSAAHGVDVPAVFGAPRPDGIPPTVAAELDAAWIRFICTGSPGWEPWSDAHYVRRFGDGSADASDELDRIAADWVQGEPESTTHGH
jgi:hypothetical protein